MNQVYALKVRLKIKPLQIVGFEGVLNVNNFISIRSKSGTILNFNRLN